MTWDQCLDYLMIIFWVNSVKYLWSYVPFLSVTPFVCFKTSEPQELGPWNFICDYIFIHREYLLLTYAAAGTLLDHHTPPPCPPPPPPPPQKKKMLCQIWILCQNSLTRELKIRVVGFVLKKLLTFFENLIVPHALHCINGCFFVFFPHLTLRHTVLVSWQPPPHLTLKKKIII